MALTRTIAAGLSALLLSAAASAAPQAVERLAPEDFDERAAEHLLNRAGFGATSLEARRLAALGPEAAVASLFEPRRLVDPFFVEHDQSYGEMRRRAEAGMDGAMDDPAALRDRRRALRAEFRRNDARQMGAYTSWWMDRMVDGDDPLRDRMTLFWAGLFTSSYREVRDSRAMIEQHQLLRDGALGSYADLLRGIAKDPAMLEYLDAASNRKSSPNENFARELLELFSLGEGHYTEADVVAAARAFTGWTDRNGEFRFRRLQHDRGEKTFLGVTGRLDGDDVIRILLAQERCAEYVAGRVLEYFEGRQPSEARVRHYAAILRGSDYQVRPLLEELFTDRAFYSDEVVGQRIAGPVDLLVGHARRLGVEPPPGLLAFGAASLGQTLFQPPSVKGWDEGRAWISTTTFMQRGNLAGVLVGTVGAQEFLTPPDLGDVFADDEPELEPAMDGDELRPGERRRGAASARRDGLGRLLDRMEEAGWQPMLNLSARAARAGATTDGAVVDFLAGELLAVPLSPETRAELLAFLADERALKSLPDDLWRSDSSEVEHLARRLAHLVLSLPEGQLH